MARKGGKGRKKLAMEKIDNESQLKVTFSSRWDWFFKKLSEICIYYDAETTLILFSPENKVHSFGHPSVAKTLNKYLTYTNVNNNHVDLMVDSRPNIIVPNITKVEEDIAKKEDDLSREKAKRKKLDDLIKVIENYHWWDCDENDQITTQQLELVKVKLEKIYNDCEIQKHKILFEANNYVAKSTTDVTTGCLNPWEGTCPYSRPDVI